MICYNGKDGIVMVDVAKGHDVAEVMKKHYPDAKQYLEFNQSDLPSDEAYCDCWMVNFNTKTLVCQMDKARYIHVQKIIGNGQKQLVFLGLPKNLDSPIYSTLSDKIKSFVKKLKSLSPKDFNDHKSVESLKVDLDTHKLVF